MSPSEVLACVSEVLKPLFEEGWRLERDGITTGPFLIVTVSHPLAPAFAIAREREAGVTILSQMAAVAAAVLSSDAVSLVRAFDGIPQHAEVVNELRIRANAEDWARERFESECDSALAAQRISQAERDWLTIAGPF